MHPMTNSRQSLKPILRSVAVAVSLLRVKWASSQSIRWTLAKSFPVLHGEPAQVTEAASLRNGGHAGFRSGAA